MKKILVLNNKYKILGGEDSNINEEIKLLNKKFIVQYLEFDNSKKMNLFDFFSLFTNSNYLSNKKILNEINLFKPDVVYIHNLWFKANLGIFKILKKNKINALVKIHNFRYYCASSYSIKKHLKSETICKACNLSSKYKIFNKYYEESYFKSYFLIRYIKKYLKILTTQDLKVLCITNFHKLFLLDSGVDKEKLKLYSNPIEIKNVKNKTKLSQSKYVVYAGRISEEKGINELIDAWNDISNNSMILRIYGTGPLQTKLSKKYSSSNVVFFGEVENNVVLDAIANARAVITATKIYEGQPRLLCEASSLGVPSIFPLFGGMVEFFPEDYIFSFNQNDHKDLVKKIELLKNIEVLESEGRRVQEFLFNKLNTEKLLSDFEQYLLG